MQDREQDWEEERALLETVAREAGVIALRYFQNAPKTWEKAGGAGPVTEADLAVDTHLRNRLMGARPGYGWLSEETEDGPERLTAERVYVVDPIDGTRSFIEGSDTWAVSAALVLRGDVVAGVVHLPAHDLTYSAALGKGAAKNGAPIRASTKDDLEAAQVLAARSTFSERFWERVPPRPKLAFRSSLAYRMALLAEGRFDAMVTLRPTWEWDIAAGALLVSEAGGAVATTAGPPKFNSPDALQPGILAGSKALVHAYGSFGARLPRD